MRHPALACTKGLAAVAGGLLTTVAPTFVHLEAIRPQPPQSEFPGGILLLPGYSHVSEQGLDSSIGRIFNSGGPEILYEGGAFNADMLAEAKNTRTLVWTKTQMIRGRRFQVVRQTGNKFSVSFHDAVFEARHVRSDEDITFAYALTFNATAVWPAGAICSRERVLCCCA